MLSLNPLCSSQAGRTLRKAASTIGQHAAEQGWDSSLQLVSQAALEAIWKTATDPSFFIEMRDEARTRRPVFLMASDASDIGYGVEIFHLTPSQAPAPERCWIS